MSEEAKSNILNVGALWSLRRVGGATQWYVVACCEAFKMSWPVGYDGLYEQRFNAPFSGPRTPFEAEMCDKPISQKEKLLVHVFGNNMLSYALRTGVG